MEQDTPWAAALSGARREIRAAESALILLSLGLRIGGTKILLSWICRGRARPLGWVRRLWTWEGMSYEDAHSGGHGCGLFCLHIIDIAFGARAGSGEPGGSGSTECRVSCDASFGGDGRCSRGTCCFRRHG